MVFVVSKEQMSKYFIEDLQTTTCLLTYIDPQNLYKEENMI